jgi:integrase
MSSLSPHTEVGYVKRNKRNGKPYGNYFGYYRFPDESQVQKVKLEIREKRFAEQRLREIIDHQYAIRTGMKPSDDQLQIACKPLAEYIEEYVANMVSRELKPETIRKISPMLRRLCDECGWSKIADLSAPDYESWRRDVDLSPKSKNHHLNTASAFSNWLIGNGWMETNPFKFVRPARVEGNETRPRRPISIAEIDRLIQCCPCPNRRMIYMLSFATGARESEMKAFRWSDVGLDSKDPTITYRKGETKNTKPERNPIPHWLAEALREFKPAEAKPDDAVFKQWLGTHTLDKDLERAGIPKLNAHGESACLYSLRHAFNQTMQEANVPIRHAQRFMRHQDLKHTANTYLDSDGLDLRSSIDKLPPVGPRVARSVAGVVEDRPDVTNGVAVDDLSQQEKTAIAVPERQSVSGRDAECPDSRREWSRGESNPRADIVSRVPLRA